MNCYNEMLKKITSSPYHHKMLQFAAPLNDHLGINHFWYYRITFSGHYCYVGTNSAWNEFCFENQMYIHFPCLRHPKTLQNGLSLMKASEDPSYQDVLKTAWEKFNINFNINLQKITPYGIEAFGFATRFNDLKAEERLINDLPVLRNFIKVFKERNEKLFCLLDECQLHLPSQVGSKFYEQPKTLIFPSQHQLFMEKIGFRPPLSLTPREKDILRFIASGYPASYIAEQLRLSQRTVENYIATLKCKLSCSSKVELIQEAQKLALTECDSI
ncbi:helix-turn-helix transcriptional regulator [Parachlamydia sp. AcF125]|uniref:response regulator transcription factor n=1 Tax=Parachlamydia sp. AcF125 TaxID=2795736 RepID=UPI001BD7FE74|nr:helix-turn-helix transcriptional regulator [Parachlamydia sp. AcF125]MBS4168711.1 Transcriptional activator protein ExaE [Parachlamydia sp. AcF125]